MKIIYDRDIDFYWVADPIHAGPNGEGLDSPIVITGPWRVRVEE